jgi:hypothetical protein
VACTRRANERVAQSRRVGQALLDGRGEDAARGSRRCEGDGRAHQRIRQCVHDAARARPDRTPLRREMQPDLDRAPAPQARTAGCQYVDRLPLPAPQTERLRSRERRQDRQRPGVRARDRPALTLGERAVVQHDREPQPLPPSGVELRLDASTADAASLQRSPCGDATCVGLRQCLKIHLLIVGIGSACSQHRRRICGSAARTPNRCAYRPARTCRSAHDRQARPARQPRRSLSAAMSLA